ncbi:SDR family oxidoreductase [Saccharopolyspora indica]|uniref:SDR family NAD(P)-dependent oxidoreductase n=1 Tax=Saccharopolyspora indica TaxID=1229659 RepID=UPI0022EA7E7E|nr:SDR family NAD(P)-dependent oxidoreductase [Saccharopolyspora indica]MDA3648114.1 SDR family NAD(P)-dependent oxidoreductase [Saccharopolyspora indica]
MTSTQFDTVDLFGGRTALVTGAGSGIGAVLAQRLARHGAAVGLLGRGEAALAEVAEAISGAGGRALVLPADVQDHETLERAVETCAAELGPVDLLVSNAGSGEHQVFLCEQTEADWQRTIDVNLTGAFRICRLVVPGMIERRSGGIVLMSSVAGNRGLPANTAYCAAKSGLHGLARALACELGPYGIRVNAVCPGLTDSPGLTDESRYGRDFIASLARHHGPPDLTWERYVRRAARNTALGRLLDPDEVARLSTYLLSELSAGITGQAVGIDGGAL